MTKIKITWDGGSWVEYKKVEQKLADKINNIICKEHK